MKKHALSVLIYFAILAANFSQANEDSAFLVAAGDCPQKANQIVASYPGGIIRSINQSASSGKTTCVIVIEVPGSNGKQPRIIRKTVSG